MKIAVTDGTYNRSDEFWVPIQAFVAAMTGFNGRLVRISRKDSGCYYRGPGDYAVTFLPFGGDPIQIDLSLQ